MIAQLSERKRFISNEGRELNFLLTDNYLAALDQATKDKILSELKEIVEFAKNIIKEEDKPYLERNAYSCPEANEKNIDFFEQIVKIDEASCYMRENAGYGISLGTITDFFNLYKEKTSFLEGTRYLGTKIDG